MSNEQFTKASEWGEYTWSVEHGKRGYFITIREADVSYTLTQKAVKYYEEKFWLKEKELADELARRTTKIVVHFNGSYPTYHWQADLSIQQPTLV